MKKQTTKRNLMYNHYIKGLCSLGIVCVLPLISPIIYFCNNKSGFLPYVMVFVAILGVCYEIVPLGYNEKLCRRLKYEKVFTVFWMVAFTVYDLTMLSIRCEITNLFNWADYCLLGFAFVPLIVMFIEFILCIREYLKENEDEDNVGGKGGKLARGKVVKV